MISHRQLTERRSGQRIVIPLEDVDRLFDVLLLFVPILYRFINGLLREIQKAQGVLVLHLSRE